MLNKILLKRYNGLGIKDIGIKNCLPSLVHLSDSNIGETFGTLLRPSLNSEKNKMRLDITQYQDRR